MLNLLENRMEFLPKTRPFVVAEAGVNHNGSPALALKLVDAAAAAGADAVKFQTFVADALASANAPKARYQLRSTKDSQLQMLRKLELSEKGHRAVLARCKKRGIRFMSTPFDEASADFLDSLGMTIFKVPSGEITNLPLLEHIGGKKKPVFLSTGMSTMAEVATALLALRRGGAREIAVLHCVSNYPIEAKDANLRAMATLKKAFGLPVGYSDHSLGLEVAFAAAALDAAILEKHFTLDKNMKGPDHAMSLSPAELKALCAGVKNVAASLGDGVKAPRPCELEVRRVARRSVVLAGPVEKGARLKKTDLTLKRPGTGIPPADLSRVIGKRLKKRLPADAVLTWKVLS